VSCVLGLFIERWLFFAQARHAVAAYFPAGPATHPHASAPPAG